MFHIRSFLKKESLAEPAFCRVVGIQGSRSHVLVLSPEIQLISRRLFHRERSQTSHASLHHIPRRSVAALGGKTNNFLGFIYKYKVSLAIGGVLITLVSVFGVWNLMVYSFQTVLGLVGIAAVAFAVLHWRKKRNDVVFDPFVRELNKHRKKLEEYLGPFELPRKNQIMSMEKTSEGRKLKMIIYQFQLEGTRGTGGGAMRAVLVPVTHSDGSKTEKWMLEKFRVDVQSYNHGAQVFRYDILDKDLSSVKYIDVPYEEL